MRSKVLNRGLLKMQLERSMIRKKNRRSKQREQPGSRIKCRAPWCMSMNFRTRKKACLRVNTRIKLRKKRNWYMNSKQRPNNLKNLRSHLFRNYRIPKRRKEKHTRSSRKQCLKPAGARGKDSAKLAVQLFLNYQEFQSEDSQEQLEAKWAQPMASLREVEVDSPWIQLWETPIEPDTKEIAPVVVSKMVSESIIWDRAMHQTAWASQLTTDY